MSRDIKFRIYDTDEKEMFYQEDIDYIDFITGIVFIHQEDGYDYLLDYKSDDGKLMQYTGLKDKNGKEIYEGDIVTYSVKGSKEINKTVMSFNEEHGAYLFGIYEGVKMPCGKKTRMNKYTRKSVNNVEVIGNIYENPELLGSER